MKKVITLLFIRTIFVFGCLEQENKKNANHLEKTEGRPFITTWKTNKDNQIISIPTIVENGEYLYNVDWGDGHFSENLNSVASHIYQYKGTYTVKINGKFPSITFPGHVSSPKLLQTIEQWGDIEWKTFNHSFSGCYNLKLNAIDSPNLSEVRDLSHMFYFATNFNGDLSNWDTSKITDMSHMFYFATSFNNDLSTWDTSSVSDMSYMFYNATSFNADLSGWCVNSISTSPTSFSTDAGTLTPPLWGTCPQ